MADRADRADRADWADSLVEDDWLVSSPMLPVAAAVSRLITLRLLDGRPFGNGVLPFGSGVLPFGSGVRKQTKQVRAGKHHVRAVLDASIELRSRWR